MDNNKIIIKNQTNFFKSMISDINKTHNNEDKHIKLLILKQILNDYYKTQNNIYILNYYIIYSIWINKLSY